MNIKQAKEYYQISAISNIHVVRDPMTTGWLMVIEIQNGKSFTLETAINNAKVYMSLDTLVKEIEGITGVLPNFTISL